jgi:hypothetical protein
LITVKPNRSVPLMYTTDPAGAVEGLTALTVGAGVGVYVNWSAGLVGLVPREVVTVMSTVPIEPVGTNARMTLSSLAKKRKLMMGPKERAVAPASPLPLM